VQTADIDEHYRYPRDHPAHQVEQYGGLSAEAGRQYVLARQMLDRLLYALLCRQDCRERLRVMSASRSFIA